MRNTIAVTLTLLTCALLQAQPAPMGRVVRPNRETNASGASSAVRNAAEALAEHRKVVENDLKALAYLRSAAKALDDPMQPSVSLQKALDEIREAQRLAPSFPIAQGILRTLPDFESANRSPATADFGHLRSLLREESIGPAERVAVGHAASLQESIRTWLAVQDQIGMHLRNLTDVAAEALLSSVR